MKTTPAANATPSSSAPTPEGRARAFMDELAQGAWDHPKTAFDDAVTAALPPEKVHAVWGQIVGGAGAYQSIEGVVTEKKGNADAVAVTCKFANANILVRLAFVDGKLAGLFFSPAPSPASAWTAPGYAKPDTFDERAVSVGASPALPGILSMPKGAAPVPAIVLVHGSGPNDEDESILGNKVFKDLAWGLASRGIAVLRYKKRTLVDPTGVTTQKSEVDDGATAAVTLLGHTAGIDPARVYLLGHSQGGYLAPRIARENPSLAGIVILAGSARPLEDSIVDQMRYFATLNPSNPQNQAAIDDALKSKAAIEDPGLRPDQDLTVLGATIKGSYFLDVRGYDPAAVAHSLSLGILVLQGERDYQVTMQDFRGWRATLAGKKNATLKAYPLLNHLFIRGEGPPSPAEYQVAGHVDEQVIADIAAWIQTNRVSPASPVR